MRGAHMVDPQNPRAPLVHDLRRRRSRGRLHPAYQRSHPRSLLTASRLVTTRVPKRPGQRPAIPPRRSSACGNGAGQPVRPMLPVPDRSSGARHRGPRRHTAQLPGTATPSTTICAKRRASSYASFAAARGVSRRRCRARPGRPEPVGHPPACASRTTGRAVPPYGPTRPSRGVLRRPRPAMPGQGRECR